VTTTIQRSFAAGEIAEALYARVDTVKYATGLRTCRNFLVMRHGGVANRPGTTFVGEVKDSTKTVRLIPFIFNADQTYVLEFGNLYMRVHRAGAQVTETAQNITAITNANPCVVTYSGADNYANGDEVYISGITGAIGTYLNNRNFKVANINAASNTFSLQYMDGSAVDSTSFGSYTSGGTIAEVYTIATPYVEADLAELQLVQSADVITLAHPNYAPRELARTGHASWALSTITFAPSIAAPANIAASEPDGTVAQWVVTAVAEETYEESLMSGIAQTNVAPTSGSPITISWDTVSGAQEYNVYRRKNGVWGFIGVAASDEFIDNGIEPDTTETPPLTRNPFSGTGNYPSAVTYTQQRLTFANTDNDPEKVWTSRSGHFKNFTRSSPLQDDDAVTFTLAGRQVNEVRHLVELGKLITLTSGGEWSIEGDEAGILKPGDINPKQHSYNGSGTLPPLIIGGNALYVQARGSIVRDLGFDYQIDGYRGNDLTVFSAHMFDKYTITDWTYQQIPHSIVWAVRSDGTLLGLTYVKEHQVLGWHRHDFDGTVENVCAVPEGNEDALYLVVKRTVNGSTKRYIERMASRQVNDIVDSIFLDAALTYDGRNTDNAHTMTLSGGTTWAYDETLTLTSSTSYFSSAEVGNQIHLTGSAGTIIRFSIETYNSATEVTGRAHKTVPAAMRSAAISNWSRAVDSVSGLWHLEGEEVSVFADGFVVANPNNTAYEVVEVTNGTLTLDKCYSVIHVGLPITADMETLDIDTAQGETLTDKQKNIAQVTAHVDSSRGLWVGAAPPPNEATDFLEGLTEYKGRNSETYDEPTALKTDKITINIRPEWNSNGRIFIRQTDPLPLAVLAVAPSGLFPFRGQGG